MQKSCATAMLILHVQKSLQRGCMWAEPYGRWQLAARLAPSDSPPVAEEPERAQTLPTVSHFAPTPNLPPPEPLQASRGEAVVSGSAGDRVGNQSISSSPTSLCESIFTEPWTTSGHQQSPDTQLMGGCQHLGACELNFITSRGRAPFPSCLDGFQPSSSSCHKHAHPSASRSIWSWVRVFICMSWI